MKRIAVLALLLLAIVSAPALAADVPTAVIVTQIPGAPGFLDASAPSPSQVLLSWSDNSTNEDGFRVERRVPAGGFNEIGTTSAGIASYQDNSVSANTTYIYRVRAYNSDGNSDYSNEDSVTTPAASGGGGGGGGGGFIVPVYATKAIFRGLAYPLSDVTLLKDAQVVATTKAGPDARFEILAENLSPGTFVFGIWAEDARGNRSITHTFSISVTLGATTVVSGIFMPPSFDTDKKEVKRGDTLTFFGTSAPSANVSILINSEEDIVKNAPAAADGTWSYKLDTLELEMGDHSARARAAKDGDLTVFSRAQSFRIGTRNVFKTPTNCPEKGDFNGDCRVNLVDYSIISYWYRRPLTAAAHSMDLNGDGKITLVDFSIIAFYWTG